MKINNKAFTLVELLVVVLIIGILAAIAVPQYQKVVMKADLHRGIPLVESLYQAQQAYYLAHGNFADNIDDLDLSLPIDEDCTKTQNTNYSRYTCSFGTFGIGSPTQSNIMFQDTNNQIIYVHFYKEAEYHQTALESDKRYCYAKSRTALEVCKGLGGELVLYSESDWNIFKLR